MQKAIATAVVLIAAAVVGWVLWRAFQPAPTPPPASVENPPQQPVTPPEPAQTAPAEPPEQPQPPPEPQVVLPALPDSDAFVRERLQPMNLPKRWMEQGDYLRRLAVLAENASRGKYPRQQLAFMAPGEPFKVIQRHDKIYVDPDGYHRYDGYLQVLDSVDPAQLASLLQTVHPLMQDALEELGVKTPPDQIYKRAIEEVLAVPVLPGDGSVELVQPNVMYQYADPTLESLAPVQKQVLRMGPENVQRLQSYLRRLAQEMNIDVSS